MTPRTILVLLAVFAALPFPAAGARPRPPASIRSAPLTVFLVDQLRPQGMGPAVNGLGERRRGPLFIAALQQVRQADKLSPATVLNPDLSLPATESETPRTPPGATLVRITLTEWSETRLGGVADTEVLCRIFVQVLRDGEVVQSSGPFLGRHRFDFVTATTGVAERWEQFQIAARQAITEMLGALRPEPRAGARS